MKSLNDIKAGKIRYCWQIQVINDVVEMFERIRKLATRYFLKDTANQQHCQARNNKRCSNIQKLRRG